MHKHTHSWTQKLIKAIKLLQNMKVKRIGRQDLVFSVKLPLGLIPWPLTLDPSLLSLMPYPLSFIPYPLSLIPCSLTPSTVPLKKFRWGLLWLSLLLLWLLSKVKVKSTPSLRPKTWSLTIVVFSVQVPTRIYFTITQ